MFTGSYTLTDTLVLQELKKIGQPVGFQPCLLHSLYELWTYENEEAEKSIPAQGENTVKTSVGNGNGERTTGNKMACLNQYMKRKRTMIVVHLQFVCLCLQDPIFWLRLGYPWLVLLLQKTKKIGSDSACGFSTCLVLL